MTETEIKNIFMDCTHKSLTGMYADEVDIVEFARAVEKAVREKAVKQERLECVKLVKTISPEIAKALEDHRIWTDRSYPS